MERNNLKRRLGIALAVLLTSFATLAAQGVETKKGAVVFYGSATTCTQPGTIDYKKVRGKTPEWKTIKADGVSKDSARYSLLVAEMDKRIKRAVKEVAEDEGVDCVVRKGDITNDNGLDVEKLTKLVIEELESEDDDS